MVKIIENYSLHEQIGEGEYGKVYRGVDSRNSRQVAVKVINVKRFRQNPKLEECTLKEIQILSNLSCPHVVGFIEILKTVNNFYFFYEYCNGGTLDQQIKRYGRLPENKIVQYLQQLIEAFKVLTARNIMHRDLKPSNILLHNGQIKLGDFGFCKGLESQRDLAQTMLGSPIYMAPQVLKGEIYTIKADIWSLGVVAYEMAFGFCPFEESSIAKLISVLDHQEVVVNRDINPISDVLETFLRKCLVKDHFKRISWEQLFNLPLQVVRADRLSPHPPHQRVLSEYNRIPKRDSDLNFDKSRKSEQGKLFKKKKVEVEIQGEQLHQILLEVVKTMANFIAANTYPQITLYLSLKCYKLVERQHRKLGTEYLKERVDFTEAVIQIETLFEEQKIHSDDSILNLIRNRLSKRQVQALSTILKLTDEKEQPQLNQNWLSHFQKQFVELGLHSS